jgi:hypothetical protein
MTDPTRQPTQEELEAHLAQLRQADVAEVVVQAVNMLATGAQVKLGRPDARVLIDAMGAIADACDGRVNAQLVKQVRDAVGQLQLAQVEAEREAAKAPTGAEATEEAAGQPGQAAGQAGQASGQAAGRPGQPGGGEQTGQRMTDRLWIPGREPGTK